MCNSKRFATRLSSVLGTQPKSHHQRAKRTAAKEPSGVCSAFAATWQKLAIVKSARRVLELQKFKVDYARLAYYRPRWLPAITSTRHYLVSMADLALPSQHDGDSETIDSTRPTEYHRLNTTDWPESERLMAISLAIFSWQESRPRLLIRIKSRDQTEPIGTNWNRSEPIGTDWNRLQPIVTNWNRQPKMPHSAKVSEHFHLSFILFYSNRRFATRPYGLLSLSEMERR